MQVCQILQRTLFPCLRILSSCQGLFLPNTALAVLVFISRGMESDSADIISPRTFFHREICNYDSYLPIFVSLEHVSTSKARLQRQM